jgi:response regulator NasT
MRLIGRAKCALIQYLDMTEAEAHRHIEKKAMDSQRPRRDIAVNIIKAYEK